MRNALLLAMVVTTAACATAAAGDAQAIDGYAAIVNKRVITVGDVFDLIQPAEEQLRLAYTGRELEERLREAYTNGLTSLIERALILEEFTAQGGALPDRYVNDRLNEFIHDRFGGDRAAFIDALSEQQITLDDWREQLRERLIVTMLRRQEVQDRITIPPSRIRAAYDSRLEQYRTDEMARLRMIMLNRGETDNEREVKLDQAAKILARLRAGEDFGAVATESSEGSRASEGGDLGWVVTSDLRGEIRDAVRALKPGEISEVIEGDDELYIVKLEESRAAGLQPYEDVRASIEKELREAEADRLYKAWTARLRRKFFVQVVDPGM